MRRVKVRPCPSHLDPADPQSAGAKETARHIAYLEGREGDKRPPFNAYKDAEVRRTLMETFDLSCAYCEMPTPSIEVEHYRPKGEVRTEEGSKPGYPWLAACWQNLLPSCHLCNTVQTTVFLDGSERMAGKGNWFPLEDETARATTVGSEQAERPLLLHPYEDRPEEHLEYGEDGVLKAHVGADGVPSRRGETTIELLGLNRYGLPQARRKRQKEIRRALKDVRDVETRMGQDPDRPPSPELVAEHEARLAELAEALDPGEGFAGMVAQEMDLLPD